MMCADMEFVKSTSPDFQGKKFTPSISLNFNGFNKKKNTKIEWKWRNLHRWEKIYTVADIDGMDKFHFWTSYRVGEDGDDCGFEDKLSTKIFTWMSICWLYIYLDVKI